MNSMATANAADVEKVAAAWPTGRGGGWCVDSLQIIDCCGGGLPFGLGLGLRGWGGLRVGLQWV